MADAMRGHGLEFGGAAFGVDGERVHSSYPGQRVAGFGRCACGDVSPESLPDGAARRAWHREHKAAIRAQATP